MSVCIRDKEFRIIKISKNLRCIFDYTRKREVRLLRIDLWKHRDGTGTIGFEWSTGATCITYFADFSVMKKWTGRSVFAGAQIVEH